MIEQIKITDREQWLGMRERDVTASDIGSLFDLSPYKTPFELWAEKTGKIKPKPPTNLMDRGNVMEIAVINKVQTNNPDWLVRSPGLYLRDAAIRIGATPDAVAVDMSLSPFADYIIQCKTMAMPTFKAHWSEGPPMHYQLQTLTEGMMWGAKRAFIAVIALDAYSYDFQMFEIELHSVAWERIKREVQNFWIAVAEGGEPPPDYARDGEAIKEVYRPRSAERIDLSTDNWLRDRLARRAELCQSRGTIEKELDAINAEIVHKLNGHERAACGPYKISHTIQHRPEKLVPAASWPVLRVSGGKE